jgi:hypothetical protein
MARTAKYECPTCGATKEIIVDHKNGVPNKIDDDLFPIRLVCGWRGCEDFARRVDVVKPCPVCDGQPKKPNLVTVSQFPDNGVRILCSHPCHSE